MEKHTCKLCFRRFSNGRALGGHMRSHVTAASIGATGRAAYPDSSASTSASSSSTSSREDDDDDDGKGSGVNYGLRENPRKSFRLVDPEFSSSLPAVDAASSVVQDRESETESPRPPPCHRRRSKRGFSEPEPVSSVSDTTAEEDVAISLMMLSRDVWTKQDSDGSDQELDEAEATGEQQIAARSRRSGFQCESCKKVFGSYQALGGHRASHKKLKQACAPAPAGIKIPSSPAIAGRKLHECPVCFRVFASGQALGGHKRSHLCSSSSAARAITITIVASSPSLPPPPSPPSTAKYAYAGESLIDLNLPAPMDEDATELSAVSDSNFAVGKHPTR